MALIHRLRTGWTLAQWQEHLAVMYAEQNAKRKPLETFARLVEMCSGMARGVRDHDSGLRDDFAPRSLAWLLGVATQMEVDLEQAVWDSYPGVCTHCRVPKDCTCKLSGGFGHRIESENDRRGFQEKYEKPKSLPEWQAMFLRIYNQVNSEVGVLKCLAHFLEELGEVSEMIRHSMAPDSAIPKDQVTIRLRHELADMFAWYCGIVNQESGEADYFMKQIYADGCPECSQRHCVCDPYHVHPGVRLSGRKGKREDAKP